MIVVDSSVVFKWVQQEDNFRNEALRIYEELITGKLKIIVPRLLFIEIGNAVTTKTEIPSQVAIVAIRHLLSLSLIKIDISEDHLLEAVKLAKKYKTSVYDMLYAVIAKQNKCKLITADRKFIEKTKFSHVIHISEYK